MPEDVKPFYPPAAFYFAVRVEGGAKNPAGDTPDARFQEVSGIDVEHAPPDIGEGGENRFVHRLPKPSHHSNLVLKRGVIVAKSSLARWCGETLDGGLANSVKPRALTVTLCNEKAEPLVTWTFANTFPVRWEVAATNAKGDEILTEILQFSYGNVTRHASG
jgi:phage tail-like protein